MGTLLQSLTWVQAKEILHDDTIVVIPLGAAAKEHGPHLRLDNDLLIAEFVARVILENCDVVVAPTVNYSYYPSFVEYAGSTTLSVETAANMIVEICSSLSCFGPRRFYCANTGISTIKALNLAKDALAGKGIILTYTDFHAAISGAADLCGQEGGSHADEVETSLMLAIAPETVDMSKAGKDFNKDAQGRLSPDPATPFSYSASGIWGDATLATVDKGRKIVEYLVQYLVDDVEKLRGVAVPIKASSE